MQEGCRQQAQHLALLLQLTEVSVPMGKMSVATMMAYLRMLTWETRTIWWRPAWM